MQMLQLTGVVINRCIPNGGYALIRHALMIDGKLLIPAMLMAMTHALDAAVPVWFVSLWSFDGHIIPKI